MPRIGRLRIGDEPQESRSVSMDRDPWARLDKAAQEDTRSSVIRQAVTEHLDKRDQERGCGVVVTGKARLGRVQPCRARAQAARRRQGQKNDRGLVTVDGRRQMSVTSLTGCPVTSATIRKS